MPKTRYMLASLTALGLALPGFAAASAQDQTRARTFEGPNATSVQTTTVNPEAGNATRSREVTNLNTGNTATSNAVRQRTETGATVSVVQTGLQGNSRSLEGERTRTDNGSTFTGTATGANGETYGLAGSRSRDGQGNSQASQSVTNGAGETLAQRDRTTTRSEGQVNRTVSRTRAEGVSRPPRTRRPRG
ncbi:MAG: hypothetical protein ACKO1N_01280 [Erythrobacter sp.]